MAADTIGTVDSLIVEVLDSYGRPLPDVDVEIAQVEDDGSPSQRLALFTLDLQRLTTLTTDVSGRTGVRLDRGRSAGMVWLRVAVPAFSLADSVQLEILPGAPAEIRLFPADTAAIIGNAYYLGATVVDRLGNLRAESTSFAPESTNVKLTVGQGVASVEATEVGRASILVSGAGLSASAWLSAVPDGVLAAHVTAPTTGDSLFVITTRTDGSEYMTLYRSDWEVNRDWYLDWLPGSQGLILAIGFGAHIPRLYHLPMTGGELERLLPDDNDDDTAELLPRAGGDGWIYYSYATERGYGTVELWRVREDGSQAARVGLESPRYISDYYPDLAPDGRHLVFATERGGPEADAIYIATMDLEAPVVEYTYLGAEGRSPVWSPDGGRIAFTNLDEAVVVMAADGTQQRVVSRPGIVYEPWIDWSPDGEWIIAAGELGVDIIGVDNDMTLPLPFSARWRKPAWRP